MVFDTPTPFSISISSSQLSLLQAKLNLVSLPDELEEIGWAQGSPRSHIKRLIERWRSGYDWRAEEARINRMMPQYTVPIDVSGGFGTLDVHFVHQESERKNAVPLLFVHGWPGSFLEVLPLLPLLTEPDSQDDPAFHVVALSLPGFGFSQAPSKKGFGTARYAEVCHKLMLTLGYDQYVTQGGDWGSVITRKIAATYGPRHARAWHTNTPLGMMPKITRSPLQFISTIFNHYLTPEGRAIAKHNADYVAKGLGYMAQQSTQPQTLGYGLSDSPVGLLAWIYEKLVKWTDGYGWTDDEVLTWVSIYWFSTAGPTASLRIYYEIFNNGDVSPKFAPVDFPSIPHGVSFFPKECVQFPLSCIRAAANVVFTHKHSRGGHFPAYEQPQELAIALRAMMGRGGPAFGVVLGRSGYDYKVLKS